jgi:chromosomal replication initiation ATPase DnaA
MTAIEELDAIATALDRVQIRVAELRTAAVKEADPNDLIGKVRIIQNIACDIGGVSHAAAFSRTKRDECVQARYVASLVATELLPVKSGQLSLLLGFKDRTQISGVCITARDWLLTDKKFAEMYGSVKQRARKELNIA